MLLICMWSLILKYATFLRVIAKNREKCEKLGFLLPRAPGKKFEIVENNVKIVISTIDNI